MGMLCTASFHRWSIPLTGTEVPRDFVEFPSTFHEDWAIQPTILSHYARHYQSGEPIPQDILQKKPSSKQIHMGHDTYEYLAAALLDLEWQA